MLLTYLGFLAKVWVLGLKNLILVCVLDFFLISPFLLYLEVFLAFLIALVLLSLISKIKIYTLILLKNLNLFLSKAIF